MKQKRPSESPELPVAELTHLFADLPAREGQVQFEFAGFAKTLAELALNPANETPFTVVVKGEWGRGKTTLLRTTEGVLVERGAKRLARASGYRQVKTVWLNAWKYPQSDTILAGLLGALIQRMRSGGLDDQMTEFVERHKDWRILGALGTWLPGGKELSEALAVDRYASIERHRAFYDQFRQLFEELSYAWFHNAFRDNIGKSLEGSEVDHLVAVFLDDLDRCPERRIRETLEAITLFADLPGVCFYLGLDWQRVSALLEASTGGRQDHFLEKVVQVEVDLPEVAEEGAQAYLKSLVTGTSLERVVTKEEQVVVGDVLTRRDPRHIKRFLNDLSIRIGLLRNTNKLQVSDEADDDGTKLRPADLLSWHLLREALPAEQWTNVSSRVVNLDGFLRRYKAAKDVAEDAETKPTGETGRSDASADVELTFFRRERLTAHLDRLLALQPTQRDLLVHLGSPPRAAVRSTTDGRARSGASAWVAIRGGTFEMGSMDGEGTERPVHRVTLGDYKIGRYPVTNDEYARYVANTGVEPPGHWSDGNVPEGKGNHPVVNASWDDARKYCGWRNARLGEPGERAATVDLPTEAQWEYAARGAGGRKYPWGNEPEPDDDHANFGDSARGTTPVGSYPNGMTPEGVHDLAGNVWEWCRDWHGAYPDDAQTNPTGSHEGNDRVLRGGAFGYVPGILRGAYRYSSHPDARRSLIGCRCVVSVSGGQSE